MFVSFNIFPSVCILCFCSSYSKISKLTTDNISFVSCVIYTQYFFAEDNLGINFFQINIFLMMIFDTENVLLKFAIRVILSIGNGP